MFSWLPVFLGVMVVGIALLLPMYARLLRDLETLNPDQFIDLGRPSLFMSSPGRGLRLQRFIYFGSRAPGIHPSVSRQSRVLGCAVPLFLAILLVILVFGALNIVLVQ